VRLVFTDLRLQIAAKRLPLFDESVVQSSVGCIADISRNIEESEEGYQLWQGTTELEEESGELSQSVLSRLFPGTDRPNEANA